MSWDATIFKRILNDHEQVAPPLGTLAEVRAKITAHFPGVTWENKRVARVQLDGANVELECDTKRGQNNLQDIVRSTFSGGQAAPPTRDDIMRMQEALLRRQAEMRASSDHESVISISVTARAGGDFITPLIDFCRAHTWALLDWQKGAFVDLDNPASAYESGKHFSNFVRKLQRRADEEAD
jgi:hypothetical protein